MAALPAGIVVTLALPPTATIDFAQRLFRGIQRAANAFSCPIIGGDTGSWEGPLAVSVMIIGRSRGIGPIRRNGAKTGDVLYVTGALGGSILGRHLTFTPRVELARRLASSYMITSMIDISDGLSRDLGHLCDESATGAIVQSEQVPIHEDVHRMPAGDRSPLEHALHDGEDYELLFTSPDTVPEELATCIGTITSDRQILLETGGTQVPLVPMGWNHQIGEID